MKLHVLLIGGGGREHALAWKLSQSASVSRISVCPGNPAWTSHGLGEPGVRGLPQLTSVVGEPLQVARELKPDLVVVGPEAPLCAGLVDQLTELGILAYGPTQAAAELEGSKAFMKRFCIRHDIPTAPFEVVESEQEAEAAISRFTAQGQVPVVKADGLCAGKGVVVAADAEEALSAAREMLSGRFGTAGKRLVLEQRLLGAEASIHAICDGERALMLPAAQDHKRLGDGDRGPNTGGMGTYAPAPLVDASLLERVRQEVVLPVLRGMKAEGTPFVGTLFVGLMIDEQAVAEPAGAPFRAREARTETFSVLEFNVRFGDPETQVLMSTLDGDLGRLLQSAARGQLDAEAVSVSARHALCVVMAAGGYPNTPQSGDVISGLEAAGGVAGALVFHAGTRLDGDKVVTAGGRVLGVTATADSLRAARDRAYAAVDCISFSGAQCRRDIGFRAL